ncbi:hypothetical protein [Dokdonia sp. Asnod1-B02]|uniref:hypothetical protein n=1 Tax=Dokdonia sp. Asnod1-B02 TaxID=3160573 RepID=UPI00386DA0A5
MKIKSTSFFFIVLLSCVYSAHSQYRAKANVAVLAPTNSNLDGQGASVSVNNNTIVSATAFNSNSQSSNAKSFSSPFPNNFQVITNTYLSSGSNGGSDPVSCTDINGNPATTFSTTVNIPSTTVGNSYVREITNLFNACSFGSISNTNIPQFFEVWHLRDLPIPTEEQSTVGLNDLIVLDPQNAQPSTFRVLYQIGSDPYEQLISACQSGNIFAPNACPGEAQPSRPQSGATIDVDLIPNLPQVPFVVRFQLDYGDGVLSNIVSYTITESSPEYSSVVKQDPLCAYELGDFTINFTETINENLRFNLFSFPEDEFLNESSALVNGSSVAWSTITGSTEAVLNPGTYRLTYQKLPSAELVPGIGDPPIIITIGSPPPLEYSVQIESEITCNDADDGKIRLTINPNNNGSIGTPPYNYVLGNGNTGNFSGNSTTISSFIAGETTIQVFDSNACTERQ